MRANAHMGENNTPNTPQHSDMALVQPPPTTTHHDTAFKVRFQIKAVVILIIIKDLLLKARSVGPTSPEFEPRLIPIRSEPSAENHTVILPQPLPAASQPLKFLDSTPVDPQQPRSTENEQEQSIPHIAVTSSDRKMPTTAAFDP